MKKAVIMKVKHFIVMMIALLSYGMATAQQAGKKYKAYMVANAHLDTQWRWDVKTTIDEFIPNTLVQNFYLLEHYPDYIINFEGAVKYAWMKEYYPEHYKRVVEYIKQGRWYPSGASWDANDSNIPSPESAFRNILLAQEFYKREFGMKSDDIFLPDCFGFSYTMPTIGAHCGLIGFTTQKLDWRSEPLVGNSKIPFPFGWWEGVDGSRIMMALDGGNYSWDLGAARNEGDLSASKDLMTRVTKTAIPVAMRYYGNRYAHGLSDRGGSPSLKAVMILEDGIHNGKGPIEIISAKSDRLFKDLLTMKDGYNLPVYTGELPLDLHSAGSATSQAEMKRYNRRNEQLADAAERSAVIADWLGGLEYPATMLNDAWQRFIWHQFHDDLTGTSIVDAYKYSWNDEIIAQSQFSDVMTAATSAVVSTMDTRVKGIPAVIYNPTAYARKSIVAVDIPAPSGKGTFAVSDPSGKQVASQVVKGKKGYRLIFPAELPPLGYAVYGIGAETETGQTVKVTAGTLENSVYKITLNVDGDISSVIDKRYGKELVEHGKAFRLITLSPNKSDRFPAWDIHKPTLDETPEPVNGNVKVSIAEQGAVRGALRVERTCGGSKFVQYIRLTEGVEKDRIDIVTEIEWATANALLKAEFPMTVRNREATYDLGLGVIRRGINTVRAHECIAQQWADITAEDGSYGISILNNCKYGWDRPTENTLRLTLLHTPSAVNEQFADQQILDFGKHIMTYSIVGHKGNYISGGIVEKAEELNQPLIPFITGRHAGTNGKSFSFAQTSTPQIAVKALKKAGNGEGYIVRVYEMYGNDVQNAELIFPAEITSALEVNGIEEEIGTAPFKGNKLIVSVGRFAPKTYRVTLAQPAYRATATQNTHIALDYNRIAISSDAFRTMAKMDAEYNSYAAELIPGKVIHGGISFSIGPADLDNAVECKGQEIKLPTDKAYNKLYILAASSDGNRDAVFKIDDTEHTAKVPYYTGFMAQWAWTGYTESFVREGTLAHTGNHRHTPRGNDSYVFTYMYKIPVNLPTGAGTLTLPNDPNVMVFAVTASQTAMDDTSPACEPRALPVMD